MADTLGSLGFVIIGNGPQLDLDKPAMDLAVQNCPAELSFYGTRCGAFAISGKSWSLVQSNTVERASCFGPQRLGNFFADPMDVPADGHRPNNNIHACLLG
jgi:hypothetical protein